MKTRQNLEQLSAVAHKMGAHLAALRDDGVRHVAADPATVRKLSEVPARRRPLAATPAISVARRPIATPASEPRLPAEAVARRLGQIGARIGACTKCRLCKSRTHTVPGQGHPAPDIMFIGEGPGADEDAQGLAFVGRAGQLLTKIIEAMGLTRDEVFIGNVVKCRPPENRTPLPDEMAACLPFLHEQVALLKPKVIVALGATAVRGLFGEGAKGITKLRGQWMSFEGIDVMPTYHPAYLLRNPDSKRDVWDDMKTVLKHLGRQPPTRKSG
jgi:uracil-DNA glycosylase